MWRAKDLRAYVAVYQLLTYTPEISLSGVGGETHRAAYSGSTLAQRLARLKTDLVSETDLRELTRRVESSLDHLGGHVDRRLEHDRQFRNRFHGGRAPLRSCTVAQLNSGKFRQASTLMSEAQPNRDQFLADIMLNLAPDLADEPYDVAGKAWTHHHRDDRTRIVPNPDRFSGAGFGTLESPTQTASRAERPLEPFMEAFHRAAPTAVDSGLVAASYVEEARRALDETDGRRFRLAVHGRQVSAVILAGEAASLSSAAESMNSGELENPSLKKPLD